MHVKREEYGEIVLKDGDDANDILEYIRNKGYTVFVLYHLSHNRTHYQIVKETILD